MYSSIPTRITVKMMLRSGKKIGNSDEKMYVHECTVTQNTPVEKSYEYSTNTNVTLPAGRYYIGDLSYAMKNSVYHGVFGSTGYSSGHYKTKDGEFLLNRTAWGDGCYTASDGYEYGVDAAIIGIASMDVCNPEKDMYGGTLHTFTEPVKCTFNNGRFEFSSGYWFLEIDTV
jgi:hypothetical protein